MNRNLLSVKCVLLLAATLLQLGCRRHPPYIEGPSGPESGRTGVLLTFTGIATDPSGDSVAVRFDWGDGDTSEWSAWLAGGATATDSHSWSVGGSYSVRAQAKSASGVLSGWSQALAVTITEAWTRTFGGAERDEACAVLQSSDGGYVVAGYTVSFGAGESQVYLVKTDASGNQQWARTYGASEEGLSARPVANGGYVIAGRCPGGICLIKTDADGNEVWHKIFVGVDMDYGQSVLEARDGGLVILCRTDQRRAGLIKTDSSGNQVWFNTFGGDSVGGVHSLLQASDGGYIFVGEVDEPGGEEFFDIWLAKADAYGREVWAKSFATPSSDDYGYSLQPTSDGGYIVAGRVGERGIVVHLIKTDGDGNEVWTREFGGPNNVTAHSIQRTSDGGYVVTGHFESREATSGDVYLLRLDASGDSLWAMSYGGAKDDFGRAVQQTFDGGFVIAGTTYSYGAGQEDVWLIKTDPQGGVGP
jgi:hypothetical protein